MRRLKQTLAAMTALVVFGGIATGSAAEPADAPSTRPVVVGYAPVHKAAAIVARPDFSTYSHINIAFANPDASGALLASDGGMACADEGQGGTAALAAIRSLVAAGHAAGAKVSISVGGGQIPACSGDWAALLHGPSRDVMVRTLVDFLEREGLDGVDLDLEGELLTRIDRAGDYTPFVMALSAELHRRGKLLTCATGSTDGWMIPAASVPGFDLVNVMAYDLVGLSWGEPGGEHSPLSQAREALALWRSRGVAKERLVLGVPFYGYGYGVLRGNYGYRDLVERFSNSMRGDVVGRRCAGCDYITFNGVETMRRKARLAADRAGGVMVWEMSEDADDGALLSALTGAR